MLGDYGPRNQKTKALSSVLFLEVWVVCKKNGVQMYELPTDLAA